MVVKADNAAKVIRIRTRYKKEIEFTRLNEPKPFFNWAEFQWRRSVRPNFSTLDKVEIFFHSLIRTYIQKSKIGDCH